MGRCFVCLRRGHKGLTVDPHWNVQPAKEDITWVSAHGLDKRTTHKLVLPHLCLRVNVQSPVANGRQSTMSMYVSTKTPVLLQTARVKVNAPNQESPVIDTIELYSIVEAKDRTFPTRSVRHLGLRWNAGRGYWWRPLEQKKDDIKSVVWFNSASRRRQDPTSFWHYLLYPLFVSHS